MDDVPHYQGRSLVILVPYESSSPGLGHLQLPDQKCYGRELCFANNNLERWWRHATGSTGTWQMSSSISSIMVSITSSETHSWLPIGGHRSTSWSVALTDWLHDSGRICSTPRAASNPSWKIAADQPSLKPNISCVLATQAILQDPVVCADGFSYEHDAVIAWLSEHSTSYVTGQPLPSKSLVPNRAIKTRLRDLNLVA